MDPDFEAVFLGDMQGGYGDPFTLPEGSRGALDAARSEAFSNDLAGLVRHLPDLPVRLIFEGSSLTGSSPAEYEAATGQSFAEE